MTGIEVIDFHTHPFLEKYERIGAYVESVDMSTGDFFDEMEKAGVVLSCGSVIGGKINSFHDIHRLNLHALKLRDTYKNYIPGIHVHPSYVKESREEIDFAVKNGIKLVGELVPYHHGWQGFSSEGFMEIVDYISNTDLIINLHINNAGEICEAEKAIALYKNTTFVLAHPGYGERLEKHLEVLGKYENAYMDISGSGIELYGALKKITDSVGCEKLLFGTDFPVTAFKTYIAAVLSEKISDSAKEHILCLNAKKILKMENSQELYNM